MHLPLIRVVAAAYVRLGWPSDHALFKLLIDDERIARCTGGILRKQNVTIFITNMCVISHDVSLTMPIPHNFKCDDATISKQIFGESTNKHNATVITGHCQDNILTSCFYTDTFWGVRNLSYAGHWWTAFGCGDNDPVFETDGSPSDIVWKDTKMFPPTGDDLFSKDIPAVAQKRKDARRDSLMAIYELMKIPENCSKAELVHILTSLSQKSAC